MVKLIRNSTKRRIFIVLFFLLLVSCLEKSGYTWEKEKYKNGITVYTRKVKGFSTKELKAIAVINHPVERVLDVIGDVKNYAKFMPDYEKIVVIKDIKGVVIEFYAVINPTGISRRDFVLRSKDNITFYKNKKPKRMKIVIIPFKNIKHPKFPKGKYIRIPYLKGYYRLESVNDGKKTRITYLYLIDLGGWVPGFIINLAGSKNAINTIEAIRKRCQQ